MPGRDGTGPLGRGTMTGRGFGFCTDKSSFKFGSGIGLGLGLGLGRRAGFRKNINLNEATTKPQKEFLVQQKELLQVRLDAINKQLENL